MQLIHHIQALFTCFYLKACHFLLFFFVSLFVVNKCTISELCHYLYGVSWLKNKKSISFNKNIIIEHLKA